MPHRELLRSVALWTNLASLDIIGYISGQGWPPELLSNHGIGAADAGVT